LPFHAPGIIADGKFYVYSGKHSPEMPHIRETETYCLDAITGEKIWSIMISGAGQHTRSGMMLRVADGYLTIGGRDGWMYTVGKGQSATTVTAPDVAVPLGTAVLIKGTVLDLSPAQVGTPCVSKESMALQMAYLHLQMPIGGVWGNETITGVPVSLTAISQDGEYYELGIAITNGYSGAFSIEWIPPAEGKYEIIASFDADESYGSSSSTTALLVGSAPEPYPSQVAAASPASEIIPYIIGIGIAMIVAVAIVGVILYKKRQ